MFIAGIEKATVTVAPATGRPPALTVSARRLRAVARLGDSTMA
jgi:hypothetical protein